MNPRVHSLPQVQYCRYYVSCCCVLLVVVCVYVFPLPWRVWVVVLFVVVVFFVLETVRSCVQEWYSDPFSSSNVMPLTVLLHNVGGGYRGWATTGHGLHDVLAHTQARFINHTIPHAGVEQTRT